MQLVRAAGLMMVPLLTYNAWAAAQTSRTDPVDVQTRYGAGVNFDLPKKWEAALKYRLRLVDNSSAYRGSYLTAEAGHSPNKHFTFFSGYRLAVVDDGVYHRYGVGAQASTRLGATTLSLRPTLQYQLKHFSADDEQSSAEDVLLRTKLAAKFGVSQALDLYGSVEPYFTFSGAYPIDNWRNTVGIKYEYAKGKKLDLFYIYRPDYAKSYNRTFHIIGIDLDLDLKIPRRAPTVSAQ